jgi:integrase
VEALQKKHKSADSNVNLAAEFIILTAVRTGEARFMRTREVNFVERLWIVPAERMKTEDSPDGLCFELPPSDRAVSILTAVIPKSASPDAFVFAGQWSKNGKKPLGMNAVLHALKAAYPAMTTHGCRSSFRDWAGDERPTSATSPKWHWLTRWATKLSKPIDAVARSKRGVSLWTHGLTSPKRLSKRAFYVAFALGAR